MKKLLFLSLLCSVPYSVFAMNPPSFSVPLGKSASANSPSKNKMKKRPAIRRERIINRQRMDEVQPQLFAAIQASDRTAAEQAFYTARYYRITIDQFCLNGITPLHAAVHSHNLTLVKFFLEKGTPINEPNANGETPLHRVPNHASNPISIDLAELLISRGADMNARDNHGNTPLHRAALVGDMGVAKFLMERGADRYVRNNAGQTAFDLVVTDKAMRRFFAAWDRFMATHDALNSYDQAHAHELPLMRNIDLTQECITADPRDIAEIVSLGTTAAIPMSTAPIQEWDNEHEETDDITID